MGVMLLARLGAETFADHADSSAAVESASEQEGLTDRARPGSATSNLLSGRSKGVRLGDVFLLQTHYRFHMTISE